MQYNIPDVVIPEITEKEYWSNVAQRRQVEPLTKTCHDCAIATGFYLPFAEMLKKQPIEIQRKVAATWFCHNDCSHGCAGIQKFLNLNKFLMKNRQLQRRKQNVLSEADSVFDLLIAEIEELEKRVEELELEISMNEDTFQQMNEH